MKKTKSKRLVAARLNEDEAHFLKDLGKGDLSAGLREAIKRAGYKKRSTGPKGYRIIREQAHLGSEEGTRYGLYLDGELLGTQITVSNSLFSALEKKYGKNFVIKDLIINAFPDLPKEIELDRIYDPDGKVVWNKYQD